MTAGGDENARLWSTATGEEIPYSKHTKAPQTSVVDAAFSPDGDRILTSGSDSVIRLWDGDSAEELKAFRGHSGENTAAMFSPDGKYALSMSTYDRSAKLWDVDTGHLLHQFSNSSMLPAFSPDGSTIMLKENNPMLRDVKTGKLI